MLQGGFIQDTSYTLTDDLIQSYTYPVTFDGWAMIGGCTDWARMIPEGCDIGVISTAMPKKIGFHEFLHHSPFEPGKGCWILFHNVVSGATISVETVD